MTSSFFINSRITKKGLILRTPKGTYRLLYPPEVWQVYPQGIKKILCDNLSFLLTINMPLVAGFKEVVYNTSMPFFIRNF